MTDEASVEIGRVVRAHGLAGELAVKLHWSGSDVLYTIEEVTLEQDARRRVLGIEGVRRTPKGVLLKLASIDDRNAAEALAGAVISVPRAALPEPGDNEFYLRDLIGARVLAPDGEVGVVIGVRPDPSVDTAIIRNGDGREVELPLVDAWLEQVDLQEHCILLSSRDGLVD